MPKRGFRFRILLSKLVEPPTTDDMQRLLAFLIQKPATMPEITVGAGGHRQSLEEYLSGGSLRLTAVRYNLDVANATELALGASTLSVCCGLKRSCLERAEIQWLQNIPDPS